MFRFYPMRLAALSAPVADAPILFRPASIPLSADNLVPHPAKFALIVDGGIIRQANGAPAIAPTDWILLLTNVQMEANGEKPVDCQGITATRIMQSYSANGGPYLQACGPAIPANSSGGNVDTAVKLVFPFDFMPGRFLGPEQFIFSLEFWKEGSWQYSFGNPTAIFNSLIRWLVYPTSATIVGKLAMSRNIWMPQQFEWRERTKPQTGTASTLLQMGVYQRLGFTSPAFGGNFAADDLIAKVNSISSEQFAYRFSDKIAPFDYAVAQTLLGASVLPNPFGIDTSALTTTKLAAIDLTPIRYLEQFETPIDSEVYLDKETQFEVNVGSPLTNRHHFYYSRLRRRESCSPTSPVGSKGDAIRDAVSVSVGCGKGFNNFRPYIPPGHRGMSANLQNSRLSFVATRR